MSDQTLLGLVIIAIFVLIFIIGAINWAIIPWRIRHRNKKDWKEFQEECIKWWQEGNRKQ